MEFGDVNIEPEVVFMETVGVSNAELDVSDRDDVADVGFFENTGDRNSETGFDFVANVGGEHDAEICDIFPAGDHGDEVDIDFEDDGFAGCGGDKDAMADSLLLGVGFFLGDTDVRVGDGGTAGKDFDFLGDIDPTAVPVNDVDLDGDSFPEGSFMRLRLDDDDGRESRTPRVLS